MSEHKGTFIAEDLDWENESIEHRKVEQRY